MKSPSKEKKVKLKGWIIYAALRKGLRKQIIRNAVYLNESVARGENGYGNNAVIPCTITFTLPTNSKKI